MNLYKVTVEYDQCGYGYEYLAETAQVTMREVTEMHPTAKRIVVEDAPE